VHYVRRADREGPLANRIYILLPIVVALLCACSDKSPTGVRSRPPDGSDSVGNTA
jgi:hypothetical protein